MPTPPVLTATALPHVQAPSLRTGRLRPRGRLHGLCVHTTGRGVVSRAAREERDPIDVALGIYSSPGAAFPHYVIGGTGKLALVADELVRAWAAGRSADEVSAYRGGWARGGSPVAALWRAAWPDPESPLDLCPDPNGVLLHVELVPTPTAGYMDAQYETLAALVADVWTRYQLGDLEGARAAGRLVGHEDVNPLARSDTGGGWDPGALRSRPRFDWQRLIAAAVEASCARG